VSCGDEGDGDALADIYPILPVVPFGGDGRIMLSYYCVVAERRKNARTVYSCEP
jgi:hypothetical protein